MKRTVGSSVVSLCLVLMVAMPTFAQAPERGAGTSQERGAGARINAQERVERIREDVAQRRATVMAQVCERRQERLQERIPQLTRSSAALKDAMDAIYERVQGFYESGQLSVSNYDELNESVASAQTEAAAAVVTAQEFAFELDCENPNVGEQMDGFRQAVIEAREELKEYRSELVELISALRAEAAEENAGDGEGEGNAE